MKLYRFLPVLVMAGSAVHAQSAIIERYEGFNQMRASLRTRQTMQAILYTVDLRMSRGKALPFHDNAGLSRWLDRESRHKKNFVRDEWGQPFRMELKPGRLTLISAGEDGKYGSTDDLRQILEL